MTKGLSSPLIHIVTLTYNHYNVTHECLSSIVSLDYRPLEIVLVDNASTDRTVARVQENFPQVRIIQNEQNLGVPSGFNVGFKYALRAGAKYVLMLNNDTVVSKNIIEDLLEVAEADPDSGIIMPKILFYKTEDKVWSNGGKFRKFPPTILMTRNDRHVPDYPHRIEYAPACGLLIRRQAFEKSGLLDPGYFFFYEDWDFSERVRAAGLNIWYVPSTVIWHKASTTTGSVKSTLFWSTYGESAARFYRRHTRWPNWMWFAANIGYIYFREILVKGNWDYLSYFHQGLLKGLRVPLNPIPAATDGK